MILIAGRLTDTAVNAPVSEVSCSVKVLVVGIKVGRAEHQDGHFARCPMADTRWDQYGGVRAHRLGYAIKLDRRVRLAFQNHVHLGVFAVVVLAGVTSDLGQVNGAGKLFAILQRASGDATGARNRWKTGQIDDGGRGTHAEGFSIRNRVLEQSGEGTCEKTSHRGG